MKLHITQTIDDTRAAVAEARGRGHTVGLVPTMGALHEGHLSLIRAARAETEYVVVTIFVNPAQFGANEDLARYPRTFDKDCDMCRAEGTDLIFAPTPATMYPDGYRTYVEVHELQEVLCGTTRPIHFRGVATVVLKLFNIIGPDVAYFGRKDAQQARLLQKMTDDLNVPVTLRICPIVREPDGLALSSRNQYLNQDQRRHAVVLYQALITVRRLIDKGERQRSILEQSLRETITATPGAKMDYASIVDYDSLQPRDILRGKVLIAVAVYFGETRLIDNLLLDVE